MTLLIYYFTYYLFYININNVKIRKNIPEIKLSIAKQKTSKHKNQLDSSFLVN